MVTETTAQMLARYAEIRKRTYGKPKSVNIITNPPAALPAPVAPKRVIAVPAEREPEELTILRAQKDALRAEIDELKRLRDEAGEELDAETQNVRSRIRLLRLMVDELEKKTVTMRYISQKIARWTGWKDLDIKSQRRTRDVVLIRQACAYWIARRTDASFPMIGRHLGGRDHTTVLHAVTVYPEKRKKMGRNLRKVTRSDNA